MSSRGLPPPRPWWGAVCGTAGSATIILAFIAVHPDDVVRAIPLLLLLIPVSLSGIVGGRRASLPVAVGSGLLYSLAFIAPRGSVRLGLTEDVATIVTFVAVALFVGAITDVRVRQLADRDRQRAVLLRSVSHDLRNPLGAIRAASADLRDEVVSDPTTRTKLLEMVVDETDRLDRIVANLLHLSRIEAGALSPALHAESVSEIAGEAVDRLVRSGSRATLAVHVPDDLPDVLVDRVQIEQVLTNLLDNATRHGAGPVCVRAARHGDAVEVTVADEGPGFSPLARARAFSLFSGDGPTSSNGIGLAVCRAIVEAHGGTIAAGERPGGGASVTFSVPAIRP